MRSLLNNPLPALLALATLATLAAAAALWFTTDAPGDEITVTLPTPTAQPPAEVKVYISGAVHSPGVYAMAEGDRLADAVEAAGGVTEEAALHAVNLAGRLKDEDHWHIPAVGEEVLAVTAGLADATGRLNLNAATAEQLMGLPGIGNAKAAAIVSYRENNGRFESVDDLLDVQGIGETILEGLRDLVAVR